MTTHIDITPDWRGMRRWALTALSFEPDNAEIKAVLVASEQALDAEKKRQQ